MANKLEVIVGTYEEFLLGYKATTSKDENTSLIQTFATRSHTASIKCVAVSGKYLASGGSDDRIFLYDMLSRKEIQILIHHNGTVNTLTFTPDASHILSGSDDGQMTAVRLDTWKMEGIWKKAHSGSPITHISCHPSGKLALSLGSDFTLRTWNLVKGRLAYTTNLKSRTKLGRMPECIAWSPNGNYFTLTGSRTVEIWTIENASVIKEQECDSKPTSVVWVSDTLVVVGLENGKLMLVSVDNNQESTFFEVHDQRVKALAYENGILATASSSGEISLWSFNVKKKMIENICSTNIGCRPTCLALVDLTQFGDEYCLNTEEETVEEECEEKVNSHALGRSRETGSVLIEYEDDDKEADTVLKSMQTKFSSKKRKKENKELSKRKRSHKFSRGKDSTNNWVESVNEHVETEKDTKYEGELNTSNHVVSSSKSKGIKRKKKKEYNAVAKIRKS